MPLLIGILICAVVFGVCIYVGPLPEQYRWIIHRNFAHRGYYLKDQTIPENSLAAFIRARDAGYGIELDVQMTKDQQIVVFHDDHLTRMVTSTPAATWPITKLAYAELKGYELGSSKEHIPLLKEVLHAVNGTVPLYIEVKYFKTDCDVLCAGLLKIMEGYAGNYAIASFNPYVLHYFRVHAPQIMRIQIAQNLKKTKQPLLQKIILENLLLNFWSKPHAISYQYNATGLSFHLLKWWKTYTLGWSIPSIEEYQKYQGYFDSIVFEQFAASQFKQS